jgi:Protein of unknown function (DUF732)
VHRKVHIAALLVSVAFIGAACSGAPPMSATPDQVFLAHVRHAAEGLNNWPKNVLVDAGLGTCIDLEKGEAPKQVQAHVADLDASHDMLPSQVSALITAAVRAYCPAYGAIWSAARIAPA